MTTLALPSTPPEPEADGRTATDGWPFVSVIVPVYNDADRLVLCLGALESQTYPTDRYECVVVDNASSQPVEPLLARFPHAIAEYEAAAGSYAARNRGIATSRGEILAFTDADCIPSTGWLEAGVAAMRAENALLLAGRIDVFPLDESLPNAVELYEMVYAFAPQLHAQSGIAATANLFTRRSVMEDVGVFDASLKSFGDAAWTSRAVDAGYEVAYCGAASVRHPARRSIGELRRRYARFAGGHYDRGSRSSGQLLRERMRALLMLGPPVRLARQVVTAPELAGWHKKAGVVAVAYLARLAYFLEWARLELGGASRRQ